ncbi:MAG: hypothetical protein GXO63_01690 [Candidatus Micrarchaeota archaeon]|nr:hypothetical protein [Candidatus Micrarchaeota archaeon]
MDYRKKVERVMEEFRFLIGSVADTVLAKVCLKTEMFPKDIKTEEDYRKFITELEKSFGELVGFPVARRIIREKG